MLQTKLGRLPLYCRSRERDWRSSFGLLALKELVGFPRLLQQLLGRGCCAMLCLEGTVARWCYCAVRIERSAAACNERIDTHNTLTVLANAISGCRQRLWLGLAPSSVALVRASVFFANSHYDDGIPLQAQLTNSTDTPVSTASALAL